MRGLVICLSTIITVNLWGTAKGYCPSSCICSSNVIVCTCKGTPSHTITLQPFHSIDYISDVFIHGCDTLRIPADTFAGLSIYRELTISDVKHLWIESFAMREMHKYPDKMTIKNCHLDILASDALAGLSRIQHLWFINITAGVVEGNAMRHTSQIEYVYFRESTIRVLQTGAFANMKNIGHLFIRGNCVLDHVHDHIFNASRIDEVILEKCTIGTLSAFAFAGALRLNKLTMNNSTVLNMDLISPENHIKAVTSAGKFHFLNTNFDKLSIMPWSNVQEIEFDSCRIEMLMPVSKIIPLKNVTQLQFKRTLVNYITDHSMSSVDMRYVVFEQSSMDTIHYNAFKDSHIEYMSMLNSRLVKFNPNAFTNATIDWFIIDGSVMYDGIHSNAFYHMNNMKMVISSSNITNVHPSAFTWLNTTTLTMDNCLISNLSNAAFIYANADSANITGNTILSHTTQHIFRGFMTSQLIFKYNAIGCTCNRNTSMDLLLPRPNEVGQWSVGHNQCTKDTQCSSLTAKKYTSVVNRHIKCERLHGYVIDCWCTSMTPAQLTPQNTDGLPFNKHIVGLQFRDCNSLHIHKAALKIFTTVTFLLLHNISNLILHGQTLDSQRKTLRLVEIKNSHLPSLPAHIFQGVSHMHSLHIGPASSIHTIHSAAFSNANIRTVLIERSKVGRIQSRVMQGATIHNFTVTKSHIGEVEKGALKGGEVAHITVTHNRIESMQQRAWMAIDHARTCFAHNFVHCQCNLDIANNLQRTSQCPYQMSNKCESPNKYSGWTLTQINDLDPPAMQNLRAACLTNRKIHMPHTEIPSLAPTLRSRITITSLSYVICVLVSILRS